MIVVNSFLFNWKGKFINALTITSDNTSHLFITLQLESPVSCATPVYLHVSPDGFPTFHPPICSNLSVNLEAVPDSLHAPFMAGFLTDLRSLPSSALKDFVTVIQCCSLILIFVNYIIAPFYWCKELTFGCCDILLLRMMNVFLIIP